MIVCFRFPLASFGIAMAATACSPTESAANSHSTPTPTARVQPQGKIMSASKPCANDNLHRSRCMIELILDDVEKEFGSVAGGGIDEIKGATSTSFSVTLPFDEKVVTWTYEFEVKDGSVAIKSRSEAIKSYH